MASSSSYPRRSTTTTSGATPNNNNASALSSSSARDPRKELLRRNLHNRPWSNDDDGTHSDLMHQHPRHLNTSHRQSSGETYSSNGSNSGGGGITASNQRQSSYDQYLARRSGAPSDPRQRSKVSEEVAMVAPSGIFRSSSYDQDKKVNIRYNYSNTSQASWDGSNQRPASTSRTLGSSATATTSRQTSNSVPRSSNSKLVMEPKTDVMGSAYTATATGAALRARRRELEERQQQRHGSSHPRPADLAIQAKQSAPARDGSSPRSSSASRFMQSSGADRGMGGGGGIVSATAAVAQKYAAAVAEHRGHSAAVTASRSATNYAGISSEASPRQLRARRLAKPPTTADTYGDDTTSSTAATSNAAPHYQAATPAVEKYLKKHHKDLAAREQQAALDSQRAVQRGVARAQEPTPDFARRVAVEPPPTTSSSTRPPSSGRAVDRAADIMKQKQTAAAASAPRKDTSPFRSRSIFRRGSNSSHTSHDGSGSGVARPGTSFIPSSDAVAAERRASRPERATASPLRQPPALHGPPAITRTASASSQGSTSSRASHAVVTPSPGNNRFVVKRSDSWIKRHGNASAGGVESNTTMVSEYDALDTSWNAARSRPLPVRTMGHDNIAAAPASAPLGGGSKVDQYLALRKQKVAGTISATSSFDNQREISHNSSMLTATSSDDDDSSTSDASVEAEDDDSVVDDGAPEWCVKLCVVSAVDFPANVVPNLPFSPVLKVGLVPLTPTDNPQQPGDSKSSEEDGRRALVSQLETAGLRRLRKCRIQSTSAKVLSKRDNGAVEFHEELRWDRVKTPANMALAVELSARAVMKPANTKESPAAQQAMPVQPANTSTIGSLTGSSRNSPLRGATDKPGIGSLFRRGRPNAEMETANAAAAVAKLLVEDGKVDIAAFAGSESGSVGGRVSGQGGLAGHQSEIEVKLRPRKRRKKARMTEDLRIGSQVIPLSKLPLDKAFRRGETARIEQWFELESTNDASKMSNLQSLATVTAARRNPSILLEISFSSPEVLDESEDEMDDETASRPNADLRASFSKRASFKIRNQLKQESILRVPVKEEEPMLEPGVVDYICVVGARDIGSQKADDGSSGWVSSTPEVCVLEQFPPSDDFHFSNGRATSLVNKIEWFCFPEGCRLWRGATPPNSEELNLRRFSASSPDNIATSMSLFDACLGCTSSFTWSFIASSSDEYGSESVKTYGACVRFFVPAPPGIDPTQDDFAQSISSGRSKSMTVQPDRRRLWVPMAICMTSTVPIIGHMEAMLLRFCEALSTRGLCPGESMSTGFRDIYQDIANLVINYQKPLPGVVSCSFPFLDGERFHVKLPPIRGLPPLPHGNSVSSVCRLIGADGINYLLAAFLTECKVLLHSDDVANVCLVAEVISCLIYPFFWTCPYIPVLPVEMLEFLEAPMSFCVGAPSCNVKHVAPAILEDIVVVDLDRDFSNDFYESKKSNKNSKSPPPLPAMIARNISKAVNHLLKMDEDSGSSADVASGQSLPRLDEESKGERELRIQIAMEVCGLLRGYQDCLVYTSASRPVFNVEKFLQTAPALYEEQRGTSTAAGTSLAASRMVLSPRSRRFISALVNCQHFHQFLEVMDSDRANFFHDVMNALAKITRPTSGVIDRHVGDDSTVAIDSLGKRLIKMEEKVPVFRVSKTAAKSASKADTAVSDVSFPVNILQPIAMAATIPGETKGKPGGVNHISLEYLVELEKNPWRYHRMLEIELGENTGEPIVPIADRVKLRDAIGDRKFRSWQKSLDSERFDLGDEASVLSEDSKNGSSSQPLDLRSLITASTDDATLTSSDGSPADRESSQKRLADAKDRDVLRRCLERANFSSEAKGGGDLQLARDMLVDAENALRNANARRFFLNILEKRSRLHSSGGEDSRPRGRSGQSRSSKLDVGAFEVLVQLSCAMLDACMDAKEYDSAYSLLELTAGLHKTTMEKEETQQTVHMTSRIGIHPIYADLGLWESVKEKHRISRQEERKADQMPGEQDSVEYEAAVATLYEMLGYGIPAEELARFASRVGEVNGWFNTDKGQGLLLLARKLCVRRDQGDESAAGTKTSDIEIIGFSPKAKRAIHTLGTGDAADAMPRLPFGELGEVQWSEISWCHPAAHSARRAQAISTAETSRRPGTQNLLNMLEQQKTASGGSTAARASSGRMKRAAVTSIAYLGSSVVATGGLDGGVFLARRVSDNRKGSQGAQTVCGIHLDWGSSGSRYTVGASSSTLDGEYGVGAVSCLAATKGAQHSYQSKSPRRPRADITDALEEEALSEAMEGCRVVAGTTCGDLRVWSIKDVLSAVFYANCGEVDMTDPSRTYHRGSGDGTSGSLMQNRRAAADFASGSSVTRLKFSLRGRALSGHRGGVSCIDVPSNVYRPDSIVSGGADGLIKLWSLRAPGTGAGRRPDMELNKSGDALNSPRASKAAAARSGDALSILSGHGGRILCVKTAWHGDRLLSGGADRTVRVWDLGGGSGSGSGGGGACLHSLSGHFGWVTSVQYWGPNTIISASTDRSICLWDARVRSTPLFSLRHHYAPISSVLVGSRTDPMMMSAALDGTVAAWDFRALSGGVNSSKSNTGAGAATSSKGCQVVREPAAVLYVQDYSPQRQVCGPVHLCRGPRADRATIQCIGSDAIIREWDPLQGEVLSEYVTGHCDAISHFCALDHDAVLENQLDHAQHQVASATLSCSWDGTVRLRSVVTVGTTAGTAPQGSGR